MSYRIPYTQQTQAELRKGRLRKFKGITFNKASGNWVAQYKNGAGKSEYIGSFAFPEGAAKAFDEAMRARNGEFARTNEALGYFDDRGAEI